MPTTALRTRKASFIVGIDAPLFVARRAMAVTVIEQLAVIGPVV